MNVSKDCIMDFIGYILISLGFLSTSWIMIKILELIIHKSYWNNETKFFILMLCFAILLMGFWHLMKCLQ